MVSNQRAKEAVKQDGKPADAAHRAGQGCRKTGKIGRSLALVALGLLLPITGHADVSVSCRSKMTKTYQQVFSRSGMGYLTRCFVAELAYQGDQLGCGCSSATATDRFVECTRKRSKKDIFYAIGFHCGAAHRKGWADR